ncbi:sulfite exporter TauE/SafE family protein [Spongiibacter taiwanensis]
MNMQLDPAYVVMLLVVGGIAGVVNTLAGGGSNLTLPALMVMGLPADIANATNRVAVLLQSIAGVRGFREHGRLPTTDLKAIVLLTLAGSLFGALLAVALPVSVLKPILLLAMLSMAAIILFFPAVVVPEPGTPVRRVADSWQSKGLLFAAGVYGGFVQAGVGFILIAALAGSLRYDLIRTNALKMLCTGFLTALALVVFVWQDLVAWGPGLVLGLGSVIGTRFGVSMAVKIDQKYLKWFLFIMTLVASAAAMFF